MDANTGGEGEGFSWHHSPQPPTLDPLERRVLELSAQGLSNREIAERLNVPLAAVRDALGASFARFGARSKLEALIVAFRRDLISPHPGSGRPLPGEREGRTSYSGGIWRWSSAMSSSALDSADAESRASSRDDGTRDAS